MSATDEAGEALVVRRLLPVPRERVFAAWLDPASLAQWMRPGDVSRATIEVDARVGGTFRIVMHRGGGGGGGGGGGAGGGDVEHWGEYLAIEPPTRLSFTWISINTDLQPSVVTVELAERGGGTELTLTHRRLPATQVDAHRKGWTDILRKLAATL